MPPTRKTSLAEHPRDQEHNIQRTSDPTSHQTKTPRNPFNPYPVSKVYQLMEPGPALLLSTGSLREGTHNLMTLCFHSMLAHESPSLLSACIGPWNASFENLTATGECVLCVPDAKIAAAVVDIGNCSGRDVDKWARFGLDAIPGTRVGTPLVAGEGVLANVECRVVDTALVRRHHLWVLQAVRAWVSPGVVEGRMFRHRGDGSFVVDGEVLDLRERMVKWRQYQ